MALTVSQKVDDGFAVLQLAGTLTLGPSLNGLRESAKQVLTTSRLSGLILEVSGVTTVDSAGLGELTMVYNFANRQNLGIRLVGTTASLAKLLEMTRLEELIPASADMPSAKRDLLRK